MKLFKIVVCIFVLNSFFAFGQEVIKHKVAKGETIYGIAKKYKLKETEIYALNPAVKNKPLQLKTILILPNKAYVANSNNATTHTIVKGDTFYGIAKQYNLSVAKLQQYNPNLVSSDLKIGMLVNLTAPKVVEVVEVIPTEIIPVNDTVLTHDEEEFSNDVIHVVKAKETLYRIAKQYKTTVASLKELNPEAANTLPLGYHLVIKKGEVPDEVVQAVNEEELAEVAPLDETAIGKADFLVQKASQYIGTRYRSGGTTSAGFDCSGLMCTTFKEVDIVLPRTSGSQAAYGIKVKRKQAQKGDLIFFATNRKRTISHVGMITEVTDSEIKFIHSSTSSGVITSSLNEPYYAKRFVQINRVLN